MDDSKLILVGGPNGSGKSTFAIHHAMKTGMRYIGADQIASDISPLDPHSARIEAARQFIVRIREAISNGESLVVESTLAGKSLQNLINEAKTAGYHTTIVFVFLDSADTCVNRVVQRVKLGGHSVPEPDIRRRFARAISNFWNLYRQLADVWFLVYNSGHSPENVAFGNPIQTIVRIVRSLPFNTGFK
jgi:predicted ABC-type ATPase